MQLFNLVHWHMGVYTHLGFPNMNQHYGMTKLSYDVDFVHMEHP